MSRICHVDLAIFPALLRIALRNCLNMQSGIRKASQQCPVDVRYKEEWHSTEKKSRVAPQQAAHLSESQKSAVSVTYCLS